MADNQKLQSDTTNPIIQDPGPGSVPPQGSLVGSLEVKPPWHRYIKEKYVYMPFVAVILIPIIGIIIASHYAILGVVFKQNYTVAVVDRQTLEPLIGAKLTMRGQTVTTNTRGLAEFSKIRVGDTPISISKGYYKSITKTVLVPLTNHHLHAYFLSTNGVEVPMTVVNQINKSPVSSGVVSVDGTSGITGSAGKTIIALPKVTKPLAGSITAPGYNQANISVNENSANNYQMIPVGKVYYLSNSSGSVDVMESNLDGSSAQVVVAGTGEQTLGNTTFVPSGDWKYLALYTTRANNTPAVYLINTSNNKLTMVDQNPEGFVNFGWTPSDSLIYEFMHTDVGAGDGLGSKLKAYDAVASKSHILDVTSELGYDVRAASSETITGATILNNGTILYTKTWTGYSPANLEGSLTTYNTVMPDGSKLKILISLSALQYPSPPKIVFTSPTSVNLEFTGAGAPTLYYTYSGGTLNKSTSPAVISSLVSSPINSLYLLSPSGKMTFWSVPTGPNNVLNVGDINASNPTAIATLGPSYLPLGWLSDSYVLVSQNGNQMFILPSAGMNNQTNILKVTDYQ